MNISFKCPLCEGQILEYEETIVGPGPSIHSEKFYCANVSRGQVHYLFEFNNDILYYKKGVVLTEVGPFMIEIEYRESDPNKGISKIYHLLNVNTEQLLPKLILQYDIGIDKDLVGKILELYKNFQILN